MQVLRCNSWMQVGRKHTNVISSLSPTHLWNAMIETLLGLVRSWTVMCR